MRTRLVATFVRLGVLGALLAACRPATSANPKAGAIAWEPPLELARGGGTKGPWQQNASRFDYVDDPTVALRPDGHAVAAWVDHRDKDVHLRVLAADGRAPTRAVNVSRTPGVFSWLPRVALSPKHPRDVYVIWQEIVFSGGTHGGEIFVARSTDGGARFAPPVNLSRSINGDGKGRIDAETWHNGSLDLVVAADGTLYAAWTEYDGPLWVTRSTDRGASFDAPVQVAGTGEAPARGPALAVAPNGRVYLAWTLGERADADIQVASAVPTAGEPLRFGPPTAVETTPTYGDAPKLAVDGDGTLHVASAETIDGPFARSTIRYTRSRDGARTFEPSRTLSSDEGSAAFPSLAVDGPRVAITWETAPAAGERPRGLAIATSRDRGRTFAPATAIPGSRDPRGTNGSHQGLLMRKLAVRGDAIVVGNSALAPGNGSRVWLIRGRWR